jgi:hypothetical protein
MNTILEVISEILMEPQATKSMNIEMRGSEKAKAARNNGSDR